MADHQPKRARQSENVHNSSNQQQDDNNGPPANANEPKAITNIYYDCLERIFDFLDLQSLLNVAGTCKRLQIAAAAKFGDDFGEKVIHVRGRNGFPNQEIHWEANGIHVGSKFSLPFLRCFGTKILHLKVCHNYDDTNDHLDEYVNRYCADTLITVEFDRKNKFLTEDFQKPFKNVEKVVAHRIFELLPNFVDLFPKLRHLEILSTRIKPYTGFTLSFPHLEHLGLWMYQSDGNALDLLPANQHLKSITIGFFHDVITNQLLDALKENTSISKLELLANDMQVNADDLIQFASEHPLLEELVLPVITAEQAIMFIRHLVSMKRFEFLVEDRSECDRLFEQLDPKWQNNVIQMFDQFKIVLTC